MKQTLLEFQTKLVGEAATISNDQDNNHLFDSENSQYFCQGMPIRPARYMRIDRVYHFLEMVSSSYEKAIRPVDANIFYSDLEKSNELLCFSTGWLT